MARDMVQRPPEGTACKPARPVVVSLPTRSAPFYEQVVIGRRSTCAADVEEFRGIPYGKADARWKHSVVRTRLPCDIFDATRNGPRCPQPSTPNTTEAFQSHLDFPQDVEESEFECLNLLVSRPAPNALDNADNQDSQKLLPVYVYIHGGALAFGAASDPMWDPARLVSRSIKVEKPIIVVNINYRLNIFGFLASSELSASGGCNFGFFDQVTSLKWISTNIRAFGGDAEKITLGGQSAGGTSVYVHALRALCTDAELRFRSCIIQSPAAGLCGPFGMPNADDRWGILCRHLGLSELRPQDRLIRLRSIPAGDLLSKVAELGWGVFTLVDEELLQTQAFCQAQWHPPGAIESSLNDGITQPSKENTPLHILMGMTNYEASIFVDNIDQIQTFQQLVSLLQMVPDHEQILQVYGIRPDTLGVNLRDGLYRLFTDVIFSIPTQQGFRSLERQHSRRPVRLSSYLFETGNPFAGPFSKKANHCVDLIYLFDAFHNALQQIDSLETSDLVLGDENQSTRSSSNAELVNAVQTRFIDFIYSDPSDRWAGSPFERAETIIYDQDRRSRVLDPSTDAKLQEGSQRIKIVEARWESAQALVSAIVMRTK